MPASSTGTPNTVTATTTAVPAPAMAHQCGFTLSPASKPNSTRIGKAATRVERIQLCNGSYAWVHAMGHLWGVVRRLLHRESDRVDDRSEEHTSELQSQSNLVCRLLLEKKK